MGMNPVKPSAWRNRFEHDAACWMTTGRSDDSPEPVFPYWLGGRCNVCRYKFSGKDKWLFLLSGDKRHCH